MVCDFIDCFAMFHDNILGTIEKMKSKVDIGS